MDNERDIALVQAGIDACVEYWGHDNAGPNLDAAAIAATVPAQSARLDPARSGEAVLSDDELVQLSTYVAIREVTREDSSRDICIKQGRAIIRAMQLKQPAPDGEAVAWVEVVDSYEGPYNFHGLKLLPVGKHQLYTRPAPVNQLVEALCEITADYADRFDLDSPSTNPGIKCVIEQARSALAAAGGAAQEPVNQLVESKAAQDVLAERRRQVEAEGWTPEHDDEHDQHMLATAGACYALYWMNESGKPLPIWPWQASWWKPSADPRRNLVKAGALLLAEIERIDRAALAAAGKESA